VYYIVTVCTNVRECIESAAERGTHAVDLP